MKNKKQKPILISNDFSALGKLTSIAGKTQIEKEMDKNFKGSPLDDGDKLIKK